MVISIKLLNSNPVEAPPPPLRALAQSSSVSVQATPRKVQLLAWRVRGLRQHGLLDRYECPIFFVGLFEICATVLEPE